MFFIDIISVKADNPQTEEKVTKLRAIDRNGYMYNVLPGQQETHQEVIDRVKEIGKRAFMRKLVKMDTNYGPVAREIRSEVLDDLPE